MKLFFRLKLFKSKAIETVIAGMLIAIAALPIIFILLDLLDPVGESWARLEPALLLEYTSNTLLLLILVALLSTTFAVVCAWLVAVSEFPGKAFVSWALLLPLAVPPYIIAYVYADFFDYNQSLQVAYRVIFSKHEHDFLFFNIRSLPGAAFVISIGLYPYIYILAKTAFINRSATLFSAARVLGASSRGAFFATAFPAARPAIIGGLALVLMETLADFGVAEYFGVPTFSTGIFRTWFALGEREQALKLAGILFVFVGVLVAIEKSSRKGRQPLFEKDCAMKSRRLRGVRAWIALLICLLPPMLGFFLPILMLAYHALGTEHSIYSKFADLAITSVSVAVVTTAIAVTIAFYFALVTRRKNSRWLDWGVGTATLGYALPGMMLAVAVLIPISQFERSVADFVARYTSWNWGLFLSGSSALLIYAYAIRFLTPAFNACESGLGRVPLSLDHAARSLGSGSWGLTLKVHLPLMYKSISVAALLVFVDTIRELPATLMLRPFNFETLATRVYRLASDERLADASLPAIVIVLIGLLPVIVLNRLAERRV